MIVGVLAFSQIKTVHIYLNSLFVNKTVLNKSM